MADAGNRNDGVPPANFPAGIHVVRPLEMLEAAAAAMVAPVLAAAERVPRPLRLVVLLIISLIVREALCAEARQLLEPPKMEAICTLISSESTILSAVLYFGANLFVLGAAAVELCRKVAIELWSGGGFLSLSSYEQLFGYNDLSDDHKANLMDKCKGFGSNVLKNFSPPSEGWELNILGIVLITTTIILVINSAGGNWARRGRQHILIAIVVVSFLAPSSLIRSIIVPLWLSSPQHFWMEAPQSSKFDSFFRVLPPALAGVGISLDLPPEAVVRFRRLILQWFVSIKLVAYSETVTDSNAGVKNFKNAIITLFVIHLIALLATFCLSGAQALFDRQPGRNWRHIDRPRQIQINIGLVMDGVEMAAPPGLMAAAPGYDAGNIGRLTTFQLDSLQKALRGVAKAVATEIGLRGGAGNGERTRNVISEGEDSRCVACWERPEVLFEPCGHACFCASCFHKWQFENRGGSTSAQSKRKNCAICDIPVLENILLEGSKRMEHNLSAITRGTVEEAEAADSVYYTTRSVARLIADVRHDPSLMAKCSPKAKAEFKKLL